VRAAAHPKASVRISRSWCYPLKRPRPVRWRPAWYPWDVIAIRSAVGSNLSGFVVKRSVRDTSQRHLAEPNHLWEDGVAHTPPRPVDIAGVFPELAGHERATVRLHPRRGRPGPRDSSIGGPVLWPATEPWPRCDAGDRHFTKVYDPDAGWPGRTAARRIPVATDPRHIAAPMVGVAQLFAGDVQGLPCPAGTDVCQVLWCPGWHEPDFGPRVRVRWRDSHDPGLDGALAVAPPSDPDTAKENYIPKPCSLSPEQTIDYPPGGTSRRSCARASKRGSRTATGSTTPT
jgi:hypothetical protein